MTEKHEKDDEIAIDFSKVKSWFKKDKKTAHKTHKESSHEHHEQKHTEHNSEHAHQTHDHKDEHHDHHKNHNTEKVHKTHKEEIGTGLADAKEFLTRYGTVLLLLIPIILTIYLRLQPMSLPSTDDWAENSVNNFYRNQVAAQIEAQYPNLPDANKQALLNTELSKVMQDNKDIIQQQIDVTSTQLKDRMMYESGNSKYVYLGDIDSYYWLRDVRKFLNNGTMCDEIDYENDICYIDTYTAAPLKMGMPLNQAGATNNGKFYAYVIVYTYKVLHAFNEDITIMQASFYVPMIFGILSALLAFLIGKAISGNLAGLVTSIIISVNPTHLSRTMGSDNDPLTMFFPLLVVLFFTYTVKSSELKKKLLFGTITGLAISLYAAAWQGWWFMFNFIMAALVTYAVFYIVKKLLQKNKIGNILKSGEAKKIGVTIATILVSSALFITLLSGFERFLTFITGPLWFTQTKVAALETFWPNVLVTVAEFNPGSIGTIMAQLGGKLVFFIGMMGVLFVMTRPEKIKKQQKYILGLGAAIYLFLTSSMGTTLDPITYMILIALPVAIGMLVLLGTKEDFDLSMAILLVIWFVATTYAALKGVRFTLLMVSAFGVTFGITINSIYKIVSKWISSELKINDIITKAVVAILLLMVLLAPVKAGYYTSTHFMPSVNDAWYNSLTNIKENSEPDAIINSWWDFGHWFKYIADRRVTLDGSSQGGPPLHWLGKLMVTDNEKISVGLLRMLDCGSNKAFDDLNKVVQDTPRSIKIINEIIQLDKKEAAAVLIDNGLTKNEASTVLKNTHCDPPEDFFITSEDMVGKAGVWAHFGSWDFDRSEMFSKVKGTTSSDGKEILLDPKFNLTPEQADQYYYEIQTQDDSQWITPWPSYMSGVQPCAQPDAQGIMTCSQGLSNGQQIPILVNLTNMDVIIPSQNNYKPSSVVYVTENGTEEIKFTENTLEFSVILIPQGTGYSSLISHPYLANSIFTRLFYMQGHGLKYFDKFDDQQGITGGRVLVWKVDWEGTNATQVYKALEDVEVDTTASEDEIDADPKKKVSEKQEKTEDNTEKPVDDETATSEAESNDVEEATTESEEPSETKTDDTLTEDDIEIELSAE